MIKLEIYSKFDEFPSSDNESILMGKTIGLIMNGSFQFESLTIYADHYKTFNLRVNVDFLKKDENSPPDFLLKNEVLAKNQYFYYFPVKMTECNYGQIRKKLINSELSSCFSCSSGTYSLNLDDSCVVCPPRVADCNSGILIINPGFWRFKQEINECTPNSEVCL